MNYEKAIASRDYASKIRKKRENKFRGENKIRPVKQQKRVKDREIRARFMSEIQEEMEEIESWFASMESDIYGDSNEF